MRPGWGGRVEFATAVALTTGYAWAQARAPVRQDARPPIESECAEVNRNAMALTEHGRPGEAADMLSALIAAGHERDQACFGVAMNNLATILFGQGRLAEAEAMAKRSIRMLEESRPPNDLAILKPLSILASAQLEGRRTGRARETLKRMQEFEIVTPQDRALVGSIAAWLLTIDGRTSDAESEYSTAISELKSSGDGCTVFAASTLSSLAAVYARNRRLN